MPLRHRGNNLTDMAQVVDDPSREKLPQRNEAKLGMNAIKIEIGFGEIP